MLSVQRTDLRPAQARSRPCVPGKVIAVAEPRWIPTSPHQVIELETGLLVMADATITTIAIEIKWLRSIG